MSSLRQTTQLSVKKLPVILAMVGVFVLSGFLAHPVQAASLATTQSLEHEVLIAQNNNNNNAPPSNNNAPKPKADPKADDNPTDNGGFVPCGNTVNDPCNIGHLFRAFIAIINYLISMAGFVAVLFIIFSGVQMVYANGQESIISAAKSRLSGAIIGLVLVAISFIAINTLVASGSLSIGLRDGGKIFTDPRGYISGK